MIKNEQNLLLEIKQRFGWPVDGLRYNLPFSRRYWDGLNYSDLPSSAVLERMAEAEKKLISAHNAVKILKRLPWVRMVLITGSVASSNAQNADDIDVWLIVEPKRIWLTRAFDWLLFTFSGKRRLATDGVNAGKTKNKFCFNFYTTTDEFELTKHTQSFAMQFVDAIPIYCREWSDYKALLAANQWVGAYFPSWYEHMQKVFSLVERKNLKMPGHWSVRALGHCIDYLAGVLMLLKSRKKLILSPKDIFVSEFTTWGTERILTDHDTEAFAKRSQKVQ